MYLRTVHAEHDIPTLRDFIRAHPLGIFTTAIDAPGLPFLQSSHIPWLLDVPPNATDDNLGKLRGHMARANPQVKAMIAELTSSGQRTLARDVLVLFNLPAHHYVTPKFYTETKPATGKTVPTWNYAAVQVYGRAKVYFDVKEEETDAFLDRSLRDLSQFCETEIMGYERPWTVDEAPESYVALLKKAIVGVEIEITSMDGKWKMSQELAEGDRKGTIEGFEGLGSELGKCMAETIAERAQKQEACRK
ncbi:negative transcriptional regulator [Lentinus tigrinus ALCF2SS1-7]|uniref:Negative transcriptional regulator n=1 Tax=Lentinus tigrinus ALCF2SS1-6 TaxID=1328759 RepID=A0A5C2S153_9APHY|nr:negative transcriptional regulator [Lentinus tigrinus ALCF2SS1-6]RPD73161.1 negative transcriptional regulator [Lentinus tigrinus ALCF2SS1-7]